jgi:hypothetical protein
MVCSGTALTTYYYGCQIIEDEMGLRYSTHGELMNSYRFFAVNCNARRKETTRKTEKWMGGWDQNGF